MLLGMEPTVSRATLLRTAIGFFVVPALLLLPGLALGCTVRALWVGGMGLAAGALFGALLALITRVRRPALIYLLLALAFSVFIPLWRFWPPESPFSEYHDALSERAVFYLQAMRYLCFICGIPLPFAGLGWHGPDPLEEKVEKSEQTAASGETDRL